VPKLPVWFDCDTGIDDTLALGQLVAQPDTHLVGISTVSGNTSAAQAAQNTLDLLALLGRPDVPVAVGAHDPLIGSYAGGAPEVHGDNGVGDVELPRATRSVEPASGVEALIAAARAHAGALHLVAVGPLTNLALALREEPELRTLVGHVTIMGGAVWAPGNITEHAEANIGNDAEAARIVLTAGWPITLVPLDVTMTHSLEVDAQAALTAQGGGFHTALAEMLDCYLSFHEKRYGKRVSALHDPMATMLATGTVQASTLQSVGIDVNLEGEVRGRTVAVEPSAEHPAVTVVTAIEDPVAARLMAALLAL
jgi:purine nucleosidase